MGRIITLTQLVILHANRGMQMLMCHTKEASCQASSLLLLLEANTRTAHISPYVSTVSAGLYQLWGCLLCQLIMEPSYLEEMPSLSRKIG